MWMVCEYAMFVIILLMFLRMYFELCLYKTSREFKWISFDKRLFFELKLRFEIDFEDNELWWHLKLYA